MTKLLKYIFLGFVFVCLCSCIGEVPNGWGLKPRMPYFHSGKTFIDGKNDYTAGFWDGCQTMLTLTGGAMTSLPVKIDGWKLTGKNPDGTASPHPDIKDKGLYVTGFWDGFEDCFYYYDWDAL